MKIKIKKRYISAVISLLLLYLVFQKMDFTQIFAYLSKFNLKTLILAIPLYFIGYILRAKRWRYLMLNLKQLKDSTLMGITFIGYAANCFMPARAGDFYRAHLAGSTFNISRVSIVSSILLERILDGIVVLGFLLFLITFIYHQPWLYSVAISAAIAFCGVGAFIYWMIKFGNIEKLFLKMTVIFQKFGIPTNIIRIMRKGKKHIESFLNGFEVLNNPPLILRAFILTALTWSVEVIFLYTIINGFGLHLGLKAALFLLCLTVFSSMIPSLSVHTGPYQCAFILALGAFGLDKEMAIAMAFVTQIIIISFLAISGIYYMCRYHYKLHQIQKEFEQQEEEVVV